MRLHRLAPCTASLKGNIWEEGMFSPAGFQRIRDLVLSTMCPSGPHSAVVLLHVHLLDASLHQAQPNTPYRLYVAVDIITELFSCNAPFAVLLHESGQ